MAYLLDDWATDCQATAGNGRRGDRQLISSMFDVSPAMAVARRSVSVVVNRLVGMGLYQEHNILKLSLLILGIATTSQLNSN